MIPEHASPYFDYKDKVNYDLIFNIKAKFSYTDGNKMTEQEKENADEAVSILIDKLFTDEDYMKEYFPEIGLGRVYGGVNSVISDEYDPEINFYLGISFIDLPEDTDINNIRQILEDDIYEFMHNLNSNIDGGVSFKDLPYGFESIKTINNEDITITIKESKKENIIKDVDKLFVTEGHLKFINNLNKIKIQELKLNDDGFIELYENNNLKESYPFSKSTIQKLCESLYNQNFKLIEDGQIDIDDAINNTQQSIEKVDQLQALKDQLEDKVNNLMNEDYSKFPSSEATRNILSTEDAINLDLDSLLNEEQKKWINDNYGSLDEIQEALISLLEMINTSNPIISISDYIDSLQNFNE